jgi:hypothetical protein
MNFELIPVLSGILIGTVVSLSSSRRSLAIGSALTVLCGSLATFMSGEYELSWGYFLVDIAQALGTALAALVVVRLLRIRRTVS